MIPRLLASNRVALNPESEHQDKEDALLTVQKEKRKTTIKICVEY